MSKELSELKDLNAIEVSLVDKGANKKKRFPIFKQESKMDEQIIKAVMETELDEEMDLQDWIEKAGLSDKGVNAVKAALRILSGFKDELPKDTMDKLASLVGYPKPKAKMEKPEEDKYPSPKEKQKEKEEEEDMKKKVKKDLDEQTNAEFEAVMKARDEQIEALKAQNEAIEKALKVEKDKRELESWTVKAREELSHIPGKTAEELATTLKQLSDIDEKLAEEQFKSMKAASDAIAKSDVFKEHGLHGAGSSKANSAWAKIEQIADGFVEKSNCEMTKAAAITKALFTEKGAQLYNEYLEEHPAQMGN